LNSVPEQTLVVLDLRRKFFNSKPYEEVLNLIVCFWICFIKCCLW